MEGETGRKEWPPLGNEEFFLVPSVGCKLFLSSALLSRPDNSTW